MLRFPIEPASFRGDVHPTFARVALGLTVYLAEPFFWAQSGAGEALRMFLANAPVDEVAVYSTSTMSHWQQVSSQGLGTLQSALSAWSWSEGRLRHLFNFQLADETGAPSTGFYYREIDPARQERAGVLQITLPQSADPADLLQIALEIGNLGPFWCAVGGYAARFDWVRKRDAFTRIYLWCQRYLGVDVQDPEELAWVVKTGIPGSNWITMIGDAQADALGFDFDAARAHPWASDVGALPLGHGLLLRAGDEPTAGDVNAMEYPREYAEVARFLAPWILEKPPEYWGVFGGKEQTAAWMRRFVDPTGWE